MAKSLGKGLILLSGGLDSVVSLAVADCKIELGLFFDYGQIACSMEKKSAKKIADFYGFPLEVVKLDWLKNITENALTDYKNNEAMQIKNINDENELQKSMKSVWVPNRNALFINIAASYCEAKNIDKIIIGANKEESKTFKDNSKTFVEKCNELLQNSANKKIVVEAPLIDMEKDEIVKTAIQKDVPLELIYSCYKGGTRHCGKCESCLHLKNALEKNGKKDLIKKLF